MTEQFVDSVKKQLDFISNYLFQKIHPSEVLKLNLTAEESLFIRFNNNKVRQSTQVEQIKIQLELISDSRTSSYTFSMTLTEKDFQLADQTLSHLRNEVIQLDPDPHIVVPTDINESYTYYKCTKKIPDNLIELITQAGEGQDLTGFWASGPQITASYNSKGSRHFFATDTFFFDYSLFWNEKAVKGCYAGRDFDFKELKKNISDSTTYLQAMKNQTQTIQKGNYRVYLAPAAVSEIIGLLNWGAFSQDNYQRGSSPLTKIVKGQVNFSELVSIQENFSLGMHPRFNSNGEVCAEQISIIKNGKYVNLLTSSRTAKEFSVSSNQAESNETARSLEISCGDLPDDEILKTLGTGFYLSNLHYLNWSDRTNARITGMTRYACLWVENGVIKGPIQDLRFDVSLFDILGKNLERISQTQVVIPYTSTYNNRTIGGEKLPGLLIKDFSFTL